MSKLGHDLSLPHFHTSCRLCPLWKLSHSASLRHALVRSAAAACPDLEPRLRQGRQGARERAAPGPARPRRYSACQGRWPSAMSHALVRHLYW